MSSKPDEKKPEVRVVLLGMTGDGKSSSGNTILGKKQFDTGSTSLSATSRCEAGIRELDKHTLVIVDTPGLLHTDKTREEVRKELLQCALMVTPGPHVFLLVLKFGKLTKQRKKILESFKEVFKDAESRTIVLFTHGDHGGAEKQNLSVFINSCAGYHVFDNRVTDESQVDKLLQKIINVFEKESGKCYKNEMFESALEALEHVKEIPEVKSAADTNQAALEQVERFVSLGLNVLTQRIPAVSSFLKKVIEAADKCMPPE